MLYVSINALNVLIGLVIRRAHCRQEKAGQANGPMAAIAVLATMAAVDMLFTGAKKATVA